MIPIKTFFLLAIFLQSTYSSKLNYLAYKLLSNLYDEYEVNSKSIEESEEVNNDYLKFSGTLPIKEIGQVGGLATEKNGNLVVFHRASRKWEFEYV